MDLKIINFLRKYFNKYFLETFEIRPLLQVTKKSSQSLKVFWKIPFLESDSIVKYILEYQEVDKVNQSWKQVKIDKDD